MPTYIKGNKVSNATNYELYEKIGINYNFLKSSSEINFNLSELSFDKGKHILVVKAKAKGYEDSNFSNEIEYII